MEFGIFHEFPSLSGGSDANSFFCRVRRGGCRREMGTGCHLAGFELHFDPERSVLSSPMCIASAIAARTQRMKIEQSGRSGGGGGGGGP